MNAPYRSPPNAFRADLLAGKRLIGCWFGPNNGRSIITHSGPTTNPRPEIINCLFESSNAIQIRSNVLIDGCYFTMGFFGCDWIRSFQVVQEQPDTLRAFLVPRDPAVTRHTVANDLSKYDEHVRLVLGPGCRTEYEFVDSITPSPQGKHRYTISLVPRPDGVPRCPSP